MKYAGKYKEALEDIKVILEDCMTDDKNEDGSCICYYYPCWRFIAKESLERHLNVEGKSVVKYVKCDTCGSLIEEGSEIYRMHGRCGIFCSPECFADAHAEVNTLTDQLAENFCATWIDSEGNPIEDE